MAVVIAVAVAMIVTMTVTMTMTGAGMVMMRAQEDPVIPFQSQPLHNCRSAARIVERRRRHIPRNLLTLA